VIIKEGFRRMYEQGEDIFYYLTVMNENYTHPPMPSGADIPAGILKGMYRFKASENRDAPLRAQLLGSGAIMNEVLQAQELLAAKYNVAADAWSVTSYKELHQNAIDVERWNLLHPEEPARVPYVTECVNGVPGVFIAASDYVRALPDSIARWFPRPLHTLGTDGFGRSDGRTALRDFFEVDARFITLATLVALFRAGQIRVEVVRQAILDLKIDPDKMHPFM
jgi:pyruvate dehydrogenase E1 component